MSSIDLRFDLADRLRKSLRAANVSVQEMADYLELGRNSIGRYINGHGRPDGRTLKLWALRTGAPYSWLRDGTFNDETPSPGGESVSSARTRGFEPPT